MGILVGVCGEGLRVSGNKRGEVKWKNKSIRESESVRLGALSGEHLETLWAPLAYDAVVGGGTSGG